LENQGAGGNEDSLSPLLKGTSISVIATIAVAANDFVIFVIKSFVFDDDDIPLRKGVYEG